MPSYFVTATDTDAGKTYITSLLLQQARLSKIPVLGLKPIASGIVDNEITDLDFILAAMGNNKTIHDINLYRFRPAIAPHIAAKQVNENINIRHLSSWIKDALAKQKIENPISLIEGVGGLMVPLNESETQIDLIKQLNIPVIVVVNIKTGCINHALLTFSQLKQLGITISAWIANRVENDIDLENIKTIEKFSGINCHLHIHKTPHQNIDLLNHLKSSNQIDRNITNFIHSLALNS